MDKSLDGSPQDDDTGPAAARRASRAVAVASGALVLVAITTVIVVVLGGDRPGSSGAAGGLTDVVQTYEPAERQAIDAFTAEMLDGTTFDSEDLRGQVAVVNVWGSWCGPCRAEAPDLARLATERAGEVVFIGINVRDNEAAAQAYERSFAVPYPSIATEDSGAALLAFRGALASAAVPSTVVLDADTRVAARVVGPVTYRTLDALITDVLGTAEDKTAQGE